MRVRGLEVKYQSQLVPVKTPTHSRTRHEVLRLYVFKIDQGWRPRQVKVKG